MLYMIKVKSDMEMPFPAESADEADHKRRVLVLGLDGATFDVIEPLARAGRLPNLSKLMEEGASGVLESTLPPVTIPAWISMMTGKNPGALGFYDLVKRDNYSVEPNGYCFKDQRPIWKILNRYGLRTGLMNLPGTYPPDEVDGFMVTGMMTPSKQSPFSYPDDLGNDLDKTVDDYKIDVSNWQYLDEGEFIKDIYTVSEKRQMAAEYLIGHIPCEFNMIVFTSTDRLHHILWDRREVVESYWEALDGLIGKILELFGEDTTVFVVSDHGFGTLERTFFVNEWLNRKGFLKVKRDAFKRGFVKIGRFVESFYHFLGKRKLFRPIASFLYKYVGIERLSKYTYQYLSNVHLESRVNWEKTKAFSCVHTPHFGQIYLNVEGRMKNGCVPEKERAELRDSIIEDLRKLPKPWKGERPMVEVYKAEDVYSGPHLEDAPDIVFLLDEGRCEVDAKVGEGRLYARGAPLSGWKGTHTRDGVFIARGPGIKKGFKVEKASIVDVTPTVLHIYGISPQDDMDGRVIDELFTGDVSFPKMESLDVPLHEKDEEFGLDDEEKALIEARLRKLGYIS